MTTATGGGMAIGMMVIAATVIGKGATIAVIAGMVAAMAVVVTTTTMTDCDPKCPPGFGHSTTGR
ncbi:hypothetical protein D3C84_1306090 [compost metagenome]